MISVKTQPAVIIIPFPILVEATFSIKIHVYIRYRFAGFSIFCLGFYLAKTPDLVVDMPGVAGIG